MIEQAQSSWLSQVDRSIDMLCAMVDTGLNYLSAIVLLLGRAVCAPGRFASSDGNRMGGVCVSIPKRTCDSSMEA